MLAPQQPIASHSGEVAQMPDPADPRYGQLMADVAVRSRPVLGDMPAPAFNALVRDIAAVKLRWADR